MAFVYRPDLSDVRELGSKNGSKGNVMAMDRSRGASVEDVGQEESKRG